MFKTSTTEWKNKLWLVNVTEYYTEVRANSNIDRTSRAVVRENSKKKR